MKGKETLTPKRRRELVMAARRIVALDDQFNRELLAFDQILSGSKSPPNAVIDADFRTDRSDVLMQVKGSIPTGNTIGARVYAIFRAAKTPTVMTSEITSQLSDLEPKDVRSAMNYLKNKNLIDKVERGIWKLKEINGVQGALPLTK